MPSRTLVVLLSLLLLSAACATSSPVRTIGHAAIDADRYRTWRWLPQSAPSVAALEGERARLHEAVTDEVARELRRRGFEHVEDVPDLYVTYRLVVQRERQHSRVQAARQNIWSGRVNVPSVHVDKEEIRIVEYDHADLIVALVDSSNLEVVWAGRIEDKTRGPFVVQMPDAISRVFDPLGKPGAAPPERDTPEAERMLAALESTLAGEPLVLPEDELLFESGTSYVRPPRIEGGSSPQSVPR